MTRRDKQVIGGSVAVLVAAGAGALVLGDGGSGGGAARHEAAGLGHRPVVADAQLGPAREPDAALNNVPVRRQPAPAPGAPSIMPDTIDPFTPDAVDPSTIWTLTPAGPVRSTTRPARTKAAPAVPVIRTTTPTTPPVLAPPVPTPVFTPPPTPVFTPPPPVFEPPTPDAEPTWDEPAPDEEPTWEEPEPVETDDWEEPAEEEEPRFFPWESGEGGLPDADTFDWDTRRLDGIDDFD
ncbi:hypothetical protein [Symbioplanes lichenis]|uniref:hypothetical protein n=1 Tax=Symbioplanes lichenis TaxID=1629072 RepID=UPI0027398A82|nr:hypothetical protein [Actinoplanes lichenis]